MNREMKIFPDLPRRRPAPPSSYAGKLMRDVASACPGIFVSPLVELALKSGGGLTQVKCLAWAEVARELTIRLRMQQGIDPAKLPPVSLVLLLIEWLNQRATLLDRKHVHSPTWRWSVIKTFVNRNRRLQSKKFLTVPIALGRAIAAHFDRPPFNDKLLVAWGNAVAYTRCAAGRRRCSSDKDEAPIGHEVFAVLHRFVKSGTITSQDRLPLKPFVPSAAAPPERFLHSAVTSDQAYIARSFALEAYYRFRRARDGVAPFSEYLRQVYDAFADLGVIDHLPELKLLCQRISDCGA